MIENPTNPLFLHHRHALVTGGSAGIGREIAMALSLNGADVTILGTNEERLNETIKYIHHGQQELLEAHQGCKKHIQERLGQVKFLIRDVRERTADIVSEAASHMDKGVDILVNNAGITRDALALRMSMDQFDDVCAINLRAPFQLMQSFLKQGVNRSFHEGAIINIASVIACTGNVGQANYTAAKAGLVGMSKTFALEAARYQVTVNTIAPGFIHTEMTDKIPEKLRTEWLAKIPLKRMGSTKDVASGVLYLASSLARYITGTVLHVNGGLYMG